VNAAAQRPQRSGIVLREEPLHPPPEAQVAALAARGVQSRFSNAM
jgi:hypothetical protein